MNFKIYWTKTDEAPALASYCLLPILKSFTKGTGIEFVEKDISLAGRILATFPDYLKDDQKVPDHLAELGELTQHPDTNIIKLPNISATIPQLKAAIKELQEKGFAVPDYPEEPKTEEEKKLKERFAKVLGSAVNPVLREGNADRRAAASVKKFAQKFPHKMMKPWSKDSKTRVAHMNQKDFYGSEKSLTMDKDDVVKIEFVDANGNSTTLKENLKLLKGEVIDAAVMNVKELRKFYEEQIEAAKKDNLLLSLHLKATMMKVSDPIMFGHAVSVYYKDALDKHTQTLKEIGANVNNGLMDVLEKLKKLPDEKRQEIENDINKVYESRPELAMVDSRSGKTNLHVPNDVIIDASMPVVIRDGGKMWNRKDELQETIAMIPDRSYATMYQAMIDDIKINGQFDPAIMGAVSNVGLMAKKAEEYGSHDKTFEMKDNGVVRIVSSEGKVLLEQQVEKGDIFRACQTKDEAIKDWVKLAVNRAKASNTPAIFWLDENRAHDREIISKVKTYLPEHDTTGLEIKILKPVEAMKYTCERSRKGLDTISVTGNVLRDYLTDLFPILELGTSARMLSIVPLLKGGGLFETGAGGSAPKHVEQLLMENHLRWDSLGEYCALVPSFEMVYEKTKNKKVKLLAETLDKAILKYLENGKLPSRKAGEIDNRGSSFYLALYWAEALANQNEDSEMKTRFERIYKELSANEQKIMNDLITVQGKPVDIGGYFMPDDKKASSVMRPSEVFNKIIDEM
ncbi:MAG: NADP-dependent isocitrate dehydrogenase [Ignavibacterium sp.]|uniref:NADP-dependent isocitrate dehydrogenase n=1 Tax=Ignavibacterium sp. TaxID=2651167 RepID=UPI00404964B8